MVIRKGFLEEVEDPEGWGGFGGEEDIPGGGEGWTKDTEMDKGKAFMNDEADIGPEAVWEG